MSDERTWLYKDGEAKIFETLKDVAKAEKAGWKDTPQVPKKKNQKALDAAQAASKEG